MCPLDASHQSGLPDVAAAGGHVAIDDSVQERTEIERDATQEVLESSEVPHRETSITDSNKLADPPVTSESNNDKEPETSTEQTDINANKLLDDDPKEIIEQSGNSMQEISGTPPEVHKDEHIEQPAGSVSESEQENHSASNSQSISDTQEAIIQKTDVDIQIDDSDKVVSESIPSDRTPENVEIVSVDKDTSDRTENVTSSETQQTLDQNSECVPAVSISLVTEEEDHIPAIKIEEDSNDVDNRVAEQRQTNEVTETVEETSSENKSKVENTTDILIQVEKDEQAISEMNLVDDENSKAVLEDQTNREGSVREDDVDKTVISSKPEVLPEQHSTDANSVERTDTSKPEETAVPETVSSDSNVERTLSSVAPVSISITVDTAQDVNHETEHDKDSNGNTVTINVEEPESSAIHRDDVDNEKDKDDDGEKEDKMEEEEDRCRWEGW